LEDALGTALPLAETAALAPVLQDTLLAVKELEKVMSAHWYLKKKKKSWVSVRCQEARV
jgi:hypothetical protein